MAARRRADKHEIKATQQASGAARALAESMPRLILEEASAGLWAAPGEAYARFRAGEWKMAEPAEYGTQYLAQFDSDAALWAHHADGHSKFDGIIDRLDAARFYLVAREAVLRGG